MVSKEKIIEKESREFDKTGARCKVTGGKIKSRDQQLRDLRGKVARKAAEADKYCTEAHEEMARNRCEVASGRRQC